MEKDVAIKLMSASSKALLFSLFLFSGSVFSQDFYDGTKTENDSCEQFSVGDTIKLGNPKNTFEYIRIGDDDYLGKGYSNKEIVIDHIRITDKGDCYPVFSMNVSNALKMLVFIDMENALKEEEIILDSN